MRVCAGVETEGQSWQVCREEELHGNEAQTVTLEFPGNTDFLEKKGAKSFNLIIRMNSF